MKDLFGNDITPVNLVTGKKLRKAEEAYRLLIQLHGEHPEKKCRECIFLKWHSASKTWPKCIKSGCFSHTRNSDWNSRWKACGAFEQNPSFIKTNNNSK